MISPPGGINIYSTYIQLFNYDKKVLENLKETEELIDYFVDMIIDVHKYVDRPEASMSAVGREAYRYMEELYAWLKKYVGESE